MIENHVLSHVLVADEVRRAQDDSAETHLIDHQLGAQFPREMWDVHGTIGIESQQIDEAVDAHLMRDVERDERLGELVSNHDIQQKQGPDAGERVAQRVNVERFALCDLDADQESGLCRIAGKNPDRGSAPDS
ncbi:hypothetical protein [Sphingomonas sp. PP-CE-1G-424]|uniref:hypothetical protein n=1 Tax=Sphingomonas sp. PP-CE-1G-424 TaxID=2135658 RepID=UPI001FB27FCC|nr:hypothetical protein [Sphingomonas sp. PP-CE-1G-424]